ncbi:MAG: response regulator, partial [Desulfovibrionaceae bacterium]
QLDDPGRAGVPIIAMTANAFEEDRRKSLEAGMNAHLAKPFKIEELFAIMGRYVSAHPAGRPDSTTTSTS